jgi:hypothetical protein
MEIYRHELQNSRMLTDRSFESRSPLVSCKGYGGNWAASVVNRNSEPMSDAKFGGFLEQLTLRI